MIRNRTGGTVDRAGKFLWVAKLGESTERALARVHSPVYQNSRADCSAMFYYIVQVLLFISVSVYF